MAVLPHPPLCFCEVVLRLLGTEKPSFGWPVRTRISTDRVKVCYASQLHYGPINASAKGTAPQLLRLLLDKRRDHVLADTLIAFQPNMAGEGIEPC